MIHLFNIFQSKNSCGLITEHGSAGLWWSFFLDVRVCHCFFWKVTLPIPSATSSAPFQEESASSLTRRLCWATVTRGMGRLSYSSLDDS